MQLEQKEEYEVITEMLISLRIKANGNMKTRIGKTFLFAEGSILAHLLGELKQRQSNFLIKYLAD